MVTERAVLTGTTHHDAIDLRAPYMRNSKRHCCIWGMFQNSVFHLKSVRDDHVVSCVAAGILVIVVLCIFIVTTTVPWFSFPPEIVQSQEIES
jgi:hypothetical protein|mmetsp:Transcript_17884/g.28365  ORF Transcript_17884/g.28365 Transcript_17884/m.28365 type:complete len:93 (+) Transcript_17884:535-813(+)